MVLTCCSLLPRRAGLPVAYDKSPFHARPLVSVAQPLPLGATSECELLEVGWGVGGMVGVSFRGADVSRGRCAVWITSEFELLQAGRSVLGGRVLGAGCLGELMC